MVKLISALGGGKVGKDSYLYQAHKKYGPIVRLKSAGEQVIVNTIVVDWIFDSKPHESEVGLLSLL